MIDPRPARERHQIDDDVIGRVIDAAFVWAMVVLGAVLVFVVARDMWAFVLFDMRRWP